MQQIAILTRTCLACPSQWEGELADGRFIYIRYRYGNLGYGLGSTLDEAILNYRYGVQLEDSDYGYISMEEMLTHLAGFVLADNAEVSNYGDADE